MAIYSSVLAWKIPWTQESDELTAMGSQRVRHDWANTYTHTHTHTHTHTPELASHLLEAGLSGHRVVDAMDVKDDRRQGPGGGTWNWELLEKQGERLAQLILGVWRAPEWPCGMTLHLDSLGGAGINESLQDVVTLPAGPGSNKVPMFTMAWHPLKQTITIPFTETLRDSEQNRYQGHPEVSPTTAPSLTISRTALQLLLWLCFPLLQLHLGEGNGIPIQYSCLENPRDGGAWWAAIYGVTQSRTWLKRLNSSSSSYISFLPCSSWMHKAYFASGPWYVIVVLPKRPHLLSSYFVFNFKVPA